MERPSDSTLNNILSYLHDFPLTPDQQWTQDIAPFAFPPSILSTDLLISLTTYCSHIFGKQPNVLDLTPPLFIVGDIHGQFADFRNIISLSHSTESLFRSVNDLNQVPSRPELQHPKTPSNLCLSPKHKYLFLGDYVDRGSFSCEVMVSLICFKILFPTQLYLIRGNHETRTMTSHKFDESYNFKTELEQKFPNSDNTDLYHSFMEMFDCLPLGAVVNAHDGKWFCVHGGIGKRLTTISQLREVDRKNEPPLNGTCCDVMWSDPLLEELLAEMNIKTDADYEEFLELDYLPNILRGCSSIYGHGSLLPFLKSNEVHGIIRAHQSKELGYMAHYRETRHHGYYYPMVLTVFSAPNYVGTHDNLGAFLHFTSDPGIEVIQYDIERAIRLDLLPNTSGERFSQTESSYTFTHPTYFKASSEPPQRSSLTSHRDRCLTAPARSNSMRRQSLTLMQQGTIGELGSEKFRQALSMGMESEKHPGWNTIRRATLAAGQFQAARRNREARMRASSPRIDVGAFTSKPETKPSQDTNKSTPVEPATLSNPDSSSLEMKFEAKEPVSPDLTKPSGVPRTKSEPTSPSPLVFSKMRSTITTEDSEQIRIMFDSIDKDKDGKIRTGDLASFLYNIEEYSLTQGEELFQQIDSNSDGVIDFEEFCAYITNLELFPEEHMNSPNKFQASEPTFTTAKT